MGVAPQYCGALGKKANGQVLVSTHYTDPYYAWPVNGQLYLPEAWAQDPGRRQRAGIPAQISFQPKWALALALIDTARQAGVPFALVVSDSGYGDNPRFLDGLAERQLGCVVQVASDFGLRLPAEVATAAAQPVPAREGPGRPRRHPPREQVAPLHRAAAVLAAQPAAAWQTLTWRHGSAGPLTKQFVAVRVHRAVGRTTGPEGWLLGERPVPGHSGEQKAYWSDQPASTPLGRLAELAHRRPSVERGYQDGKDEVGLAAYAARKWESFHHHLAIEFLVLSFLALHRPPVPAPAVVPQPQPVTRPDEPIFPLRAGTVPEYRPAAPAGERVPGQRAGALARRHRARGRDDPTGAAPLGRVSGPVPQPVT